MIFGAKRIEQLEDSVHMLRKGPLEEGMVKAVNEMWEDVEDIVVEKWL